jgi:type I restriction-modification system DNA methylase subunit
VQLIDATQWYKPLRKNLGSKNCELGEEDIQRIVDSFLDFKETEQSKIFPNKAFGYWKVKVERPLKLRAKFTRQAVEDLRFASGEEDLRSALYEEFGDELGTAWTSCESKLKLGWMNKAALAKRKMAMRMHPRPKPSRRRSARSCWMPRPGNATCAWPIPPSNC